jgi:hypothetical protein
MTDEKTYEDGLEEGVAIERIRVLNLIDEYINSPDIDLEMLIESIEDV